MPWGRGAGIHVWAGPLLSLLDPTKMGSGFKEFLLLHLECGDGGCRVGAGGWPCFLLLLSSIQHCHSSKGLQVFLSSPWQGTQLLRRGSLGGGGAEA